MRTAAKMESSTKQCGCDVPCSCAGGDDALFGGDWDRRNDQWDHKLDEFLIYSGDLQAGVKASGGVSPRGGSDFEFLTYTGDRAASVKASGGVSPRASELSVQSVGLSSAWPSDAVSRDIAAGSEDDPLLLIPRAVHSNKVEQVEQQFNRSVVISDEQDGERFGQQQQQQEQVQSHIKQEQGIESPTPPPQQQQQQQRQEQQQQQQQRLLQQQHGQFLQPVYAIPHDLVRSQMMMMQPSGQMGQMQQLHTLQQAQAQAQAQGLPMHGVMMQGQPLMQPMRPMFMTPQMMFAMQQQQQQQHRHHHHAMRARQQSTPVLLQHAVPRPPAAAGGAALASQSPPLTQTQLPQRLASSPDASPAPSGSPGAQCVKLSPEESRELLCAIHEVEHQEDLSWSDADWFLEAYDAYYESTLTPPQRKELESSSLRSKRKHRHAILFEDDRKLIVDTNNMAIATHELEKGVLGRHLVRESCRVLAQVYAASLEPRESAVQGCVWSALMDRVRYHIVRAGFKAEVRKGQSRNNEATLYVEDHSISRSNLRKVIIDCRKALGMAVLPDDDGAGNDSD